MRKIVSLMHMSLDGLVADRKGEIGWIKMDDELFAYYDTFISKASTAVYGPTTFQMMEVFWPGVLHDESATGHMRHHAQWYAKAEKVVFSKKLQALQSPSAKLASGELTAEVGELKQQIGDDIMIFGSPRLVRAFTAQNLIDEYIISINPVIVGQGTRMFDEAEERIELKLVSSAQFPQGGVVVRYER